MQIFYSMGGGGGGGGAGGYSFRYSIASLIYILMKVYENALVVILCYMCIQRILSDSNNIKCTKVGSNGHPAQ